MKQLKVTMWECTALLQTLTIRKAWNVVRVGFSYVWSRITRKAIACGFPYAVSIEPTSICNLKCPECPTGAGLLKRPRGSINTGAFKKMIDRMSDHLIYLNLYIQGEPFMHPEFETFVEYATDRGIYTSSSTNGHFIDAIRAERIVKSGLKRLIFSIDGVTQESYAKYRVGGKLEKVKQAVESVVKAKKNAAARFPIIEVQFLVFRHNEHEIQAIQDLVRNLGGDRLVVKTAQFNEFGNDAVLPPRNLKLSRYQSNKTQGLQKKMHNHCWRQWHSAVITWDGRVSPCCYDKDSKYSYGNLLDASQHTVFKGSKGLNFKSRVLSNKQGIDICQNCPEGRSLLW